MIELTETAPAPVLPVEPERLSEHLRLGAGFAEPSGEEALLLLYLTAATASVERRLGQALIARGYRLRVSAWNRAGHLVLPVGPVAALAGVAFTGPGEAVALDPAGFAVVPGRSRQRVRGAGGGALPPIPAGHMAEITFTAGYGPAPADVPADIAEAVLLLAAHFHDDRTGTGAGTTGLPPAVARLLAPHGPVRL